METFRSYVGTDIVRQAGSPGNVNISWSGMPSNITIHSIYLTWRGYKGSGAARGYLYRTNGNIIGGFNDGQQACGDISDICSISGNSGSCTVSFRATATWYSYNEVYLCVDYTVNITKSTVTSVSVNAGETATVTISNPKLTQVMHRITWVLGNATSTWDIPQQASGTSITASCTIPIEWLQQMPNALTGYGAVIVETFYNGTSLGTNSASLAVSAPQSTKPDAPSITVAPVNDNQEVAAWGIFLQGFSGARATATAAGKQGASIARYIFTGAIVGESENGIASIESLPKAGTLTVSVQAVDSRGLVSAAASASFVVHEYSTPSISTPEIFRCLMDGTEDPGGGYVYAKVTVRTSSCDGHNTRSIVLQLADQDKSNWANLGTLVSGEGDTFAGWLDGSMVYWTRIIVQDSLNTAIYEKRLTVDLIPLHIKNGGTGVGLGQPAALNGLTVNPDWPVRMYGALLIDLIYPVGSIYMSTQNAPPQFGGTWTAIQDTLLMAAGTQHQAASTGYVQTGSGDGSYLTVYMWQRTA